MVLNVFRDSWPQLTKNVAIFRFAPLIFTLSSPRARAEATLRVYCTISSKLFCMLIQALLSKTSFSLSVLPKLKVLDKSWVKKSFFIYTLIWVKLCKFLSDAPFKSQKSSWLTSETGSFWSSFDVFLTNIWHFESLKFFCFYRFLGT